MTVPEDVIHVLASWGRLVVELTPHFLLFAF